MPSTQHLRQNIASVTAIKKITSAMKVVAASQLRRAQESANNTKPYRSAMGQIISTVMDEWDTNSIPVLTGRKTPQKHLYIIATSQRGLCGSFNGGLLKQATTAIQSSLAMNHQVKILFLGKKGIDQFKKKFPGLVETDLSILEGKIIDFNGIEEFSRTLWDNFDMGQTDEIFLVYNQFKSAMVQMPTVQTMIPMMPLVYETATSQGTMRDKKIYIFEPRAEDMPPILLRRFFTTCLYGFFLENRASELGARMVAMDNATRNSTELLDRLKLKYNQIRQGNITRELIEIISGAESV